MSYTVETFRRMCPAYALAIDEGRVGFEAFTRLQPWYLLPDGEIFDVREKWPSDGNESPLIAFAVRQDCDDIACFEIDDDKVISVLLIEGWSSGSFSVICEYSCFEEWFKSAEEDATQWS